MRTKSLFRYLLAVAALTFGIAAAHAAQPVPGKDYTQVRPPQPTDNSAKIEVLEFFFYGCPHCNNLQPSLEAWLKNKPADVDFRRIPAVFQDSWVPLTRAYYAIEAMGLVEKLHHDMFETLHKKRIRLQNAEAIFEWAASKGVDRKKFADTFNSFGVNGRTQRSIELTRKYDIPGTPAMAIDGRFLTAPSMTLKTDRTVDYERFFQVVDALIAEARKTKGSK
ncbi:MAG: thiol:disulfide interchange protein DsbA/DsbL [Burkholderiales bacterium]